MFILYDLVFLIFALVYLPLYLLRGKFNRGFLRRLGVLPANLYLDRPIWIHAVSVGEASAIKGLLFRLRQVYPGKQLVISTVTSTGNKIAQGLVKEGDLLTYLPLDFSFIVKRVLKKINPCMFIIAETEIWPNLISCLDKMQISVITVNGRISDSSYGGYRLIKILIRPILRKVKQFCVQSELDGRRLESLGVDRSKIQVTGNLKFDIGLNASGNLDGANYRHKLWLNPNDKLLVCGSTHPNEEKIILEAYQEVLPVFPGLKLLIAPRHPERSNSVMELVQKHKFMPVAVSGIAGACPTCIRRPVFILDTIGELMHYYAAADIVFVGGSMVRKGGHNILEPASLNKPVIFGPYMFNFRQISELFLESSAGLVAANSRQLAQRIKELLSNDLLARGLAERASGLILKNRGATEKNIQIIKQLY